MQETLATKEDVHLGHCVAEALGSAAQASGLFVAAFLQLFKFGEVLVTILLDGVLGGNSIIPLSSHRFPGGNCSVALSAKFLTSSCNSGYFIRVLLLQRNHLGAKRLDSPGQVNFHPLQSGHFMFGCGKFSSKFGNPAMKAIH